MIPEIKISEFDYDLPDGRIAKYPLEQRDMSKLLRYSGGEVSEHVFKEIPELIPADSIMVFNDTKVVPARLHFQRETGAHIEIFCLEPVKPAEYNLIFAETSCCSWKCIVGNARKWKSDILKLYNPENDAAVAALDLKASLIERNGETSVVGFSWNGGLPFSKVLEICGTVPIPPYLNRESEAIDTERYQTLYAKYRGSVAAPTAGLHFTQTELDAIRAKGTYMETVCLRRSRDLPSRKIGTGFRTQNAQGTVRRQEILYRRHCRKRQESRRCRHHVSQDVGVTVLYRCQLYRKGTAGGRRPMGSV